VFGPAARRVPWVAMGTTAAGCAAIVWWRASLVESNLQLIQVLRLAAVSLAASASTCLEDGCEPLTVATPYGRLRRRALTLGLTTVVVVTIWCGVALVGAVLAVGPESDPPLPLAGLFLELVALVTCGWFFAAATIAGFGWRGSAMRAAVGLVVAAICTLGHPQLYEWLWPVPSLSPNWRAGQLRWITIAVAAIAATMVLSLDPASRRVARTYSS
jgi:hypothetical protein